MKHWLHIAVQYLKLPYQEKHKLHFTHMHKHFFPNESMGDIYCSRTLMEQQVERLLASVTGSSKPSVINFTVNFHPRNHCDRQERLDTEMFEWETRLAADKGATA